MLSFSPTYKAHAQNGQALFAGNCASCHQVHKVLVGPALAGVEQRWKGRAQLHAWIHNPAGYMKTDGYTQGLFNQYNHVMMTSFPGLSDKEIDAMYKSSSRAMMTYIMEDGRYVAKVIDILWVLRSLERIGAHARNIAEQLIFCITGEDVRYQKLNNVKESLQLNSPDTYSGLSVNNLAE